MTEMQRAFAVAYVENGHNATQAALTAGASENGVSQTAYKWLRLTDVKNLISQMEADAIAQAQEKAKKAMLTPEMAVLILTEIASNTNNKPSDRTSALKVYLDHFGVQANKDDSKDNMLETALTKASEVWDYATEDNPY